MRNLKVNVSWHVIAETDGCMVVGFVWMEGWRLLFQGNRMSCMKSCGLGVDNAWHSTNRSNGKENVKQYCDVMNIFVKSASDTERQRQRRWCITLYRLNNDRI